ncbi:hypothetical protein EIN_502090 [Entamoeba invadens IP1]|uniref:RNB domain-containing protein n=1 Tax=Entamoeba invadens IP1 TaxID=370355 RepID=A0A0A1TX91_ENTIV|nr:hypothetical protein EIN_502090 [Entamoeba invadens IP1]ELP84096.1 hypothetical protein EIN_502090 [Entamoeba invadens IP1]|eukprot:XP_004183442.1 hypothetical protein EIN_502090 [Entamoeba invadens IP1]
MENEVVSVDDSEDLIDIFEDKHPDPFACKVLYQSKTITSKPPLVTIPKRRPSVLCRDVDGKTRCVLKVDEHVTTVLDVDIESLSPRGVESKQSGDSKKQSHIIDIDMDGPQDFAKTADDDDDCILEKVVKGPLNTLKVSPSFRGVVTLPGHNFEYEYKEKLRKKYQITPRDKAIRTDITMRRVFTVDTDNTKLRDDAFHIEVLSDNRFELGMHCVDTTDFEKVCGVDSFLKLDEELSRAKHVKRERYGNKTEKMAKKFFSLDIGQVRRAISIIVVLNANGEVVENPQMCQSLISVKCNMNQEQFECILKKKASGDANEWSSYDTTETHNCGRVVGTTLQQLKNDVISIHNIFCYHLGKVHSERLNGSVLVAELGRFVGRYIGMFLEMRYGEYAMVQRVNGMVKTHFRSPLRKFQDTVVLKQLVCAMGNKSVLEMTKKTLGVEPLLFKRFVYNFAHGRYVY